MFKLLIFLVAGNIFLFGCNGQERKPVSKANKETYLPLEKKQKIASQNEKPVVEGRLMAGFNFRIAARKATPAVVHIKSFFSTETKATPDFWSGKFWSNHFSPDENTNQALVHNASGVIISSDGYIVTNNHVINNARSIEVVLHDQRSYKATIIGTDPATDLALLKIEEKKLKFIEFGNSDSVEVGDIVLTVGNPFNLASTVTAGIVSAKARNINILTDKAAVESYIQTDAVVNPGNSGGALVDVSGKLIGISGAIATPTGVYAGYSFAIPVEIVKTTIDDLLRYGKVLRGYLGVIISEMNGEKARQLGIGTTTGVMVDSLQPTGAAMKTGIQKNDVIIRINDHYIETGPQFREIVARHHPGEKLRVTVIRKGKEQIFLVTLIAAQESVTQGSKEQEVLKILGIEIEEISSKEKSLLQISGGVKVVRINEGIISQATIMQEGFIIMSINAEKVVTRDDFFRALNVISRLIIFGGIYADEPGVYYYAIGI